MGFFTLLRKKVEKGEGEVIKNPRPSTAGERESLTSGAETKGSSVASSTAVSESKGNSAASGSQLPTIIATSHLTNEPEDSSNGGNTGLGIHSRGSTDAGASFGTIPRIGSFSGTLPSSILNLSSSRSNSVCSSTSLYRAAYLKEIDIDNVIERLIEAKNGKASVNFCIKDKEIKSICGLARETFLEQNMILDLGAPVHVVGDIHGQFNDLIRIFEMCGYPPNTNYLFLGDYVDRGKKSLETIMLLLCYKVKYPFNFFLLRGNHECASVNRVYGFYDECKRRANVKIWKHFTDVFNCMPIAATIARRIFCVHGGISPSLYKMDDILELKRPVDVPSHGLLNDLLWSDPCETSEEWEDNERGVSFTFGKRIINDFLQKFDLDLVCRAHMVVEEGYEFFGDRTLVTVFSAPNYCGEFDNKGAVMTVNAELMCSFDIIPPLLGIRKLLTGTDHSPLPSGANINLRDEEGEEENA